MVEKSDVAPSNEGYWNQFMGPMRHFGQQVADFFAPSSEAASSDNSYIINVELPGVPEDDIHVEIHDRRLTISGEKKTEREEKDKNYYFSERAYGAFKRSFSLPEDADSSAVTAEHKNGLLQIVIPRIQPQQSAARKIEVQGSK